MSSTTPTTPPAPPIAAVSTTTTATTGMPPPSASRLIIHKITFNNFKSYAGERVIGPMHKRFTSVVGPNGSGKSNLIDGLMFAFGKTAKKMRSDKIAHLINSSAENAPADEARVEIEFLEIDETSPKTASYEDEGYDVVPNSNFTLARVAHSNNTSTYYLNNKRCSAKDVAEFMMTKGVDVNNNRFLILQGEVEAIASMAPKGATKNEEGLLEFLEDLIGTNKYVEDIEKGQAQVEALSETRGERLNQVKAIEKEVSALEGPMTEALKFKNLEMDKNTKLVTLSKFRLSRAERTLFETTTKRESSYQLFKSKEGELTSLRQEAKVLEAAHEKERSGHAKLTATMEATAKEFATFERRAIQDAEKRKQFMAKKDKAQEAATKCKEKAQQERVRLEQSSTKLPQVAAQVKALEKELVTLEDAVEKVRVASRGESDAIHKELDAKNTILAPLAAALREAESEVQVAQTELDLCSKETLRARVLLKEAQQEVAALEGKIAQAGATIKIERTSQQQQQHKLDGMITHVKQLEDKEAAVAEELANAKVAYEKASAAVVAAKQAQQQHARQAHGGGDKTVNALKLLLAATRTKGGPLAGCTLAGRLGDLGAIAPEYDVAVTTAAPMLDALVCETTEGAERCVAFLREQGLGTSTFIILEKLAYLLPQMSAPAPVKDANRLFDLITPSDEKYKVAFYFATRDTLVARDLDEAATLAYVDGKARHRVVTLNGEMIDVSGTMAGGGKARKGGMGGGGGSEARAFAGGDVDAAEDAPVLLTDKELAALEKRVAELTQTHAKTLSAAKAGRADLDALEKSVAEITRRAGKLEMEMETSTQKLASVKTRIVELQPRCEASAEERQRADELRVVLDDKVTKHKQRVAAASSLHAEVELLQRRLSAVGGDKMKQAKTQVESCRSKLDAERAELTKLEVASEAATAMLQKLSSQTEKAGGELEKALAAYEAHEQAVASNEAKAREVLIALERAKEAETEKRVVCERIKKEHMELKNSLNIVETAFVEMKIQLDAYDDEIKGHKSALEKWKKDLHAATVALEQWKQAAAAVGATTSTTNDEGNTGDDAVVAEEEATSNNEVAVVDEQRLEAEIKSLEAQAAPLRGNVNMGAIAEYTKREAEYLARVAELDEATASRDAARLACDELRKKRLVEFMAGFSVISLKLKEVYQLITLGGDAELELVDSLDPFSEGVVFSVRPPKKSWKNISNLSGGEKTLSSLSLVFALHYYKPAPLYVMDEIDAALDFKNVSIVANYIKERTTNAQFIIISLRNNMFELADRLVGVYKTDNATKSVTINPNKVALKSGLLGGATASTDAAMMEQQENVAGTSSHPTTA